MAVPVVEQIAAPTEQVIPVADPVEGAVADAENRAVPTFDLTTPEGVRAAAEQFPAMKAVFSDYENAATQRRDRQIRLERGTEDVARAWQDHLASTYGVQLNEADKKDAPLWVRANRDTERAAYWRTQTEQVLDAYDVSDRQKITAALEEFDGLPEQTEAVARQVIDTAVSRMSERRIA